MALFAVLATGNSLTAPQVASVRSLRVVVVSDAYQAAPWAEALVSQDRKWWEANPDALKFAGRKFAVRPVAGVEKVEPGGCIQSGTNSGLLALEVAKRLGAKAIAMFGFDLHGTHYFGPHPPGLKRTDEEGFRRMRRQFHQWAPSALGLRIINCTPGSTLTAFPSGRIEDLC